jgi:FkbM family methyltransferase
VLQHASLNRCENLRAVNAAVSDKEETLTFILASSNNMGANSIVPWDGPVESTFAMTGCTLPDLLKPDEITRTRVIKIDVEGAEGAVIRGLVPLFPQLRHDVEIAVEVCPDRMAKLGERAEELLRTMEEHGFHAYRLRNNYAPQSYPRAVRRPEAPRRWHGPVVGECDLVFSRLDTEELH